MTEPTERRGNQEREDTRLLAYQINEMRTSNNDFQKDVHNGLDRIERKIDDNMESMIKRHERHESRIVALEQDRAANASAHAALDQRATKATLSWQVWVGIAVGLIGLFLAFLAIIATVLIAIL